MTRITEDFVDFALRHRALRFGAYTLKSGHRSAYFFNTAVFNEGAALEQLGGYYATRIIASGIDFDMLFGPAYKGITLAAATASSLARRLGRPVPFCHDRKEVKDHGEGGILSGADPGGRKVLLVDDVLTAGTSARHATDLLRQAGARPVALIVALDRCEEDAQGGPVSARLSLETGLAVHAVIDRHQLTARLAGHPEYSAQARALQSGQDSGTSQA